MKTYNKFAIALGLGLSMGAMSSCIDADLDDALDYDKTYTDANDANKHILGIYSQFMDLAEQMVVLGELRGDLMSITPHANDYLQEVEADVHDAANPYLQSQPYYSIINNCNDALANFTAMKERRDLSTDEYAERYSDVMAMRCYVYLQLVSQFGQAYYLDTPITSVGEMEAYQKTHKPVSIDEILPLLIDDMLSCPTLEDYQESDLVINGTNAVVLNGVTMKHQFINKKLLLGDLYLWAGRSQDDYRKAAYYYKEVINLDANSGDDNTDNLYYRCKTFTYTGSALPTSAAATSYNYCAGTLRYRDQDEESFFTTWPYMFADEVSSRPGMYEWIWTLTFKSGSNPQYPFIDLFASQEDGGSYQLRPSQNFIAYTRRTDILRNNQAPYDPRGLDATYTVAADGDTVCAKYLGLYNAEEPDKKEGRLWLYRAAGIHLRFAEAMNRAGYPDFAYGFIMGGLDGYYGATYPDVDRNGNVTTPQSKLEDYRGLDRSGRYTGRTRNIFGLLYPISLGICDNPTDSALLYFDNRYMTTASSNLYDRSVERGGWRSSSGIRGRQLMQYRQTSDFSSKTLADCATLADSIYLVEKILLDETALETAHEGNRWGDLVRVARRMNRSTTVTVNGQTSTLTNDGMTGDEYFQTVMARKSATSINILGTPDYSAGEASWFIKE